MIERRSNARHKVFKAGAIQFNRAGWISCTVRDLSPNGACVEVASPLGVPEAFQLVIATDKAAHRCRLVWHSARRIGVAFV